MRPPRASGPGFPGLLFTPANRPFTLVILVSVVALGAYLLLSGGGDPEATGTTEASSTTAAPSTT